ncbi:hypothetical protein CYMTET_36364 [Cymbomonas tetramitiformis]|uniref:Rho-GAP domain-containing protein n=1 Tax=Cymbomonas tetramitiformis TaxID=36881 RepID=A0AAE0CHU8_9CHLO|nr:hypothetical protein CYMTET_36364 [Cymbomonas tetramitiformis]
MSRAQIKYITRTTAKQLAINFVFARQAAFWGVSTAMALHVMTVETGGSNEVGVGMEMPLHVMTGGSNEVGVGMEMPLHVMPGGSNEVGVGMEMPLHVMTGGSNEVGVGMEMPLHVMTGSQLYAWHPWDHGGIALKQRPGRPALNFLYEKVIAAGNSIPALIRDHLQTLPLANFAVLRVIVEILHRTAMNSDINKMDAEKLAAAFSPVLIWPDPSEKPAPITTEVAAESSPKEVPRARVRAPGTRMVTCADFTRQRMLSGRRLPKGFFGAHHIPTMGIKGFGTHISTFVRVLRSHVGIKGFGTTTVV